MFALERSFFFMWFNELFVQTLHRTVFYNAILVLALNRCAASGVHIGRQKELYILYSLIIIMIYAVDYTFLFELDVYKVLFWNKEIL